MTTRTRSWLRRYSPRPAVSARVFCFPHAGGSASTYREWATGAPWDVEFVGVQYPGHEDLFDVEPAATVRALVDGAVDELWPLLDLPFLLFGHSMGAVVAYEVARRLEVCGHRAPRWLVVSGRPAPHRSRPGAVHLGSDDELVADVVRLGGTDEGVFAHPGLREVVLPVVRHDYRLIETYRPLPGPTLRAATAVLHADDDPEVTAAEARAWCEATTGPCDVLTFRGGHFYFSASGEPVVGTLVDLAREACAAGPRWPSTP